MPLKLELEVEKTTDNKFNVTIGCYSTHGKGCSLVSLRKDTAVDAIIGAIQPLLVISPNFTQEELDKHNELYGYP